jgi:hypothetical protein
VPGTPCKRNLEETQPTFILLIEKEACSIAFVVLLLNAESMGTNSGCKEVH